MSDQASLEAIETLELINGVDNPRTATDPFKLPATGATSIKTLVTTRLADLKTKVGTIATASGSQTAGQVRFRRAVRHLQDGHRAGKRHLEGLVPDFVPVAEGNPPHIGEAERAQLLESYGFAGGLAGDLTDTRVLDLARQVPIAAAVAVVNPAWHYPADLQAYIAAELVQADGNQTAAQGGTAATAIEARDVARELALDIIARVRFHYCGASDAGDRTVELRRIGMQPRRLPGEAQPQPLPGAPGTVTHDAAAKTLTVPALPENATSIRAYRRVLGGDKVLAGVSTTTTVGYAAASPLEPGATYDVWLVGHNSEGDGAESQHFTVVVPPEP